MHIVSCGDSFAVCNKICCRNIIHDARKHFNNGYVVTVLRKVNGSFCTYKAAADNNNFFADFFGMVDCFKRTNRNFFVNSGKVRLYRHGTGSADNGVKIFKVFQLCFLINYRNIKLFKLGFLIFMERTDVGFELGGLRFNKQTAKLVCFKKSYVVAAKLCNSCCFHACRATAYNSNSLFDFRRFNFKLTFTADNRVNCAGYRLIIKERSLQASFVAADAGADIFGMARFGFFSPIWVCPKRTP